MKHLVAKLLLLLVPLEGLVLATTLWQDPAQLFGDGRPEDQIAEWLASGRNIVGIGNEDERRIEARVAKRLPARRQVLVLGSSRMMQVRSGLFPGKTFFNAAVSGACLQDLAGIYQLYHERGFVPEHLVLGLDPWLLNAHRSQERCGSMEEPFQSFAREAGITVPKPPTEWIPRRFLAAVSPSYFQDSLIRLLRNRGTSPRARATSETAAAQTIRLGDGSLVYDAAFRNQSPEQVDAAARRYGLRHPIYLLDEFRRLDPSGKAVVRALVNRAREDGARITIVLCPYHPDAYELMMISGRYENVRHAEAFFRSLGRAMQTRVVGSYDPAAAGIDRAGFFDGMHPTEAAFGELLTH